MVIGMTTVVSFLCLLVVVMHISAYLFRNSHTEASNNVPVKGDRGPDKNRDMALAIAVALQQRESNEGA